MLGAALSFGLRPQIDFGHKTKTDLTQKLSFPTPTILWCPLSPLPSALAFHLRPNPLHEMANFAIYFIYGRVLAPPNIKRHRNNLRPFYSAHFLSRTFALSLSHSHSLCSLTIFLGFYPTRDKLKARRRKKFRQVYWTGINCGIPCRQLFYLPSSGIRLLLATCTDTLITLFIKIINNHSLKLK